MITDPSTVRIRQVVCYRVPRGATLPLCIDGHAYRRRTKRRRK